MYVPDCAYHVPVTLAEALELLGNGGNLLPLAGGTDLVVLMKDGKLNPDGLMSLRKIEELRHFKQENGTCTFGAGTTVSGIGRSSLARTNPSIRDAVKSMATPQIRNRATVGGNLCTAAACADFPPVLLINDAVLTLESAAGKRELSVTDFITGARKTDLRPGELMTKVSLRRVNPGTSYIKFGIRRAANISVVAVACSLELDGDAVSRVTLASVAASPRPVLIESPDEVIGRPADRETFEILAEMVREKLRPISDLRSGVEHRLHLGRIGAVRALETARDRLSEARDA
jgi:carbon-monoxide dehydrogenase medium subunit